MTQAATVTELNEASPSLSRVVLAKRAMNVGRSHISATVNTLFLAYVGASLPLIVLFAAGRQDPLLTASMEVVAVEIVRAVVGSIGIVAGRAAHDGHRGRAGRSVAAVRAPPGSACRDMRAAGTGPKRLGFPGREVQ